MTARTSPAATSEAPLSTEAARGVRTNSALRQARTCYGHLAGVVGVRLLDELLAHGWLVGDGDSDSAGQVYRLTPRGKRALAARNVAFTRAASCRARLHLAASTGPSAVRTSAARSAGHYRGPSKPPATSVTSQARAWSIV